MKNRLDLCIFLVLCLVASTLAAAGEHMWNVRTFGAAGDGKTFDTTSIQEAIDAAHTAGGGIVYFPSGVYLTETIVLKDSVTLQIDGATLLGSTTMTEFKPEFGSFRDSAGRQFGAALIFARGAKRIGIRGSGVINGQGFSAYYPKDTGVARPSIIRLIDCSDVRIQEITLINSAAWVQHYVGCEDLIIRDVKVRSYSNKNNDGLDIESCERVLITGCNIDSGDDSIVLKALSPRACRDIVISDCIVAGLKSAIKIGTETAGDFENITISNCVFNGTRGLTFYTVDGGDINNVTVSNIAMRSTYGVICLRLGSRMRPYAIPEGERPQIPGRLRNILISHVQAVDVTESNCFISGIPSYPIENVTFDNIRIEYGGGGEKTDSDRVIPENEGEYPKPRMFGTLSAYGLYIRHVRNLRCLDMTFTCKEPDRRSAIVCDDVRGFEMRGLQADAFPDAAPFIHLNESRDVLIRDTKPLGGVDTFLHVGGRGSGSITLLLNDFSRVGNPVSIKSGLPKRTVISRFNYSH